ncbi:MAG TPA: Stp1/IreP family PP2C-type Ser/Thr phosphatase [Solirubrobacteraceae bacterium]|nr:Stp1/IreP family PP2C-type Ser/Thr phosphatase [Solirubrobacteraceae bacterium]
MLTAAETIVRTDVGRQRSGNEDSAYAQPPVFVLADGMGGAQSGEVASQIVVDAFARGLPAEGTAEERLSMVVQRANKEIHSRSQNEIENAGMGTTVTAAYLDADALALAHVGDSRAYLLRDGELTRLTEDHSLVEELLRGGKLTEEQALDHPQRSVITRALGIEPIVEIDTWTYPVRPGDVVLLCSDGLTDMLPEQQIEETLVEAPDLSAAAALLVDAANAAGGRDNITVVLFRVAVADDAAAHLDQPTVISYGAGPLAGAVAGAPAPAPQAPKQAQLARLQGFKPHMPAGFVQPAGQERHFGRLGKTVAGLTALAFVLCLIGGGGYLASRQLYFLGTNGQGTVVVYRGFPYVLPLGIPMYETFYVSGVPASTIPASYRAKILDHAMRDQTSATKLINNLELGEISK